MNEQNASQVNGANTGSEFQPPTRNPQDASAGLQDTRSGLQSSGTAVLGANTTILVPTSNGAVAIAPTGTSEFAASKPVAAKHPPAVAWVGAGLVVVLLAVMAIGIIRPRKH